MTVPVGADAAQDHEARRRGFNLWEYARALDASDLPAMQRHIALRLAMSPVQGSDGVCAGQNFSYPAIARNTGYGRSTVIRAMHGLDQAGWLDTLPAGRGKRNAYRLHEPSHLEVIHNPSRSDTGTDPDPSRSDTGTRPAPGRDPSRSGTPIYPLLTEVPSIVERVRARLRATCPDLTPDDDEISTLVTNLERSGVRNAAGYLHKCPPADIRRLLADAKPQVNATTSTNQPGSEAPDEWCETHDQPGGTTTAGTPRCPQCRRAAQISRSTPFSPSLDGPDRPAGPNPADGLSAPLSGAVAG